MITCSDILQIIDNKAPFDRAESWDNVGLLIGDPDKKVERILFALDVTLDVVHEAVAKKVDLIISHHPVLFTPTKSIRWDTYKGRLLKELMLHDLSVLCAHTNVDIYPSGINGFLAEQLELKECIPLKTTNAVAYYKLAVFVPSEHVDPVLGALFDAGAGKLGFYEACAFRQDGIGQFKPVGKATPFIGEQNVLEMVEETKVEVMVSHLVLEKVLKALFDAHPYEEPAFDLFILENKEDPYGLGVVGNLEKPMDPEAFLARVKSIFGLNLLKQAGFTGDPIQRVAICSGAGGDLMDDALQAQADVFITGDLRYHDGQKAMEEGLLVLDVGHHASESFTKGLLMSWVEESVPANGLTLYLAEAEQDFFRCR